MDHHHKHLHTHLHFGKHSHHDKENAASVPSITTVAIAGITGKLGRLIAKHLLASEGVQVHGIARNPDRLPNDLKSNPRLKFFKSKMQDAGCFRDAIRGCSILISVVLSDPATEISMQKAMIDACVIEGVPRFMPNEFTLDWRCVDLDLLPQKRGNLEVFEYLDTFGDKIKGVHILIGGFMETMFSYGYWFDPTKSPADGLSVWGDGNDIWELTSYNNAAQWTAAAALDPEATGYLRFVGDRLSVREVAKTLEEVYKLPPIPISSKGSLDELKALVKRGMEQDPDSKDFWTWKGQSYALFLSNGHGYLEAPLNNANYLERVETIPLEDWLEDKKLEDLSKTANF